MCLKGVDIFNFNLVIMLVVEYVKGKNDFYLLPEKSIKNNFSGHLFRPIYLFPPTKKMVF